MTHYLRCSFLIKDKGNSSVCDGDNGDNKTSSLLLLLLKLSFVLLFSTLFGDNGVVGKTGPTRLL
jgi:uncharacterized membrane protein YeiB